VCEHKYVHGVYLWLESIPSLIQGTKNTIGNHSLLQRGVFNVKLWDDKGGGGELGHIPFKNREE
jgi:hypothetical protein